jgi:hypothetical protein
VFFFKKNCHKNILLAGSVLWGSKTLSAFLKVDREAVYPFTRFVEAPLAGRFLLYLRATLSVASDESSVSYKTEALEICGGLFYFDRRHVTTAVNKLVAATSVLLQEETIHV